MYSRKLGAIAVALVAFVASAVIGVASASAGVQTLGLDGWQVQSTRSATDAPATISAPTFAAPNWMPVKPDDGHAPGTEIAVLLQNGVCPDVFYSDNMARCWQAGNASTTPPDPAFNVPWWYRTTFTTNLTGSQHAQLVVNGIMGQADIWVNGHKVGDQGTVQGAFTQNTFDVTSLLNQGSNAVAIKVYPNNPKKMFTSDFVDWSQVPPDNNTGIVNPVELHTSDALRLDDAHVVQRDADDLSTASLTVKGSVTNSSGTDATATVSATVDAPAGSSAAPITVSRNVSVPADSTVAVNFAPSDYPTLVVHDPQLWWPAQMGTQPLYTLHESVAQGGASSDAADPVTFGIRTVNSFLSKPSTKTPYGSRWFTINNKPFVVRGGGFTPDLFWRYSSTKADDEIQMIHNLGLNAVRTEGKEFPDEWYEKMDKAGILVYGGFTCCNKWQDFASSNVLTETERNVVYNSSYRIGQRERDHPSVFTFSWSDNAPAVDQENLTLTAFAKADFDIPVLASAEYKSTARLGESGLKEGPYNWEPPDYWYDTDHIDTSDSSDLTNQGSAWGFDSEASGGHTIPTMDSLNRFMSPGDLTHLAALDPTDFDYDQYHNNTEAGHGSYTFGSLYFLDTALQARYGAWSDLNGYVEKAQAQNYETQRAEFEAYIAHSTRTDTPSTGLIYWMLNKGWPSMLWQLYNYDYDQAGSFFGAKKANTPVHALYELDRHKVTVDNLTGSAVTGLSVESRVMDTDGSVIDDQTASDLTLPSQGVLNDVISPRIDLVTASPRPPIQTYFVELTLRQNGKVIDRNVYWQSTQDDQMNWSATKGSDYGQLTQYADLTGLNGLGTATASATASTAALPAGDADGNDTRTSVTITNTTSTPIVGFLLRADVRRGNADGTELAGDNEVLPISWSDNDITLWPGESQTITGDYKASALQGASPVVSLTGWNTAKQDVAAPGAVGAPASQTDAAPAVAPSMAAVSAVGAQGVPAQTNTIKSLTKAKAKVAVAKVSVVRKGATATATVTCRGAAGTRCSGTVRFTQRVAVRKHGKVVGHTVVIGHRRYSVKAGKAQHLSLRAARVRSAQVGVTLAA